MLQRLIDNVFQKFRMFRKLHRSVFDPRCGEQIFHQIDHPDRVLINIRASPFPLFFIQMIL